MLHQIVWMLYGSAVGLAVQSLVWGLRRWAHRIRRRQAELTLLGKLYLPAVYVPDLDEQNPKLKAAMTALASEGFVITDFSGVLVGGASPVCFADRCVRPRARSRWFRGSTWHAGDAAPQPFAK